MCGRVTCGHGRAPVGVLNRRRRPGSQQKGPATSTLRVLPRWRGRCASGGTWQHAELDGELSREHLALAIQQTLLDALLKALLDALDQALPDTFGPALEHATLNELFCERSHLGLHGGVEAGAEQGVHRIHVTVGGFVSVARGAREVVAEPRFLRESAEVADDELELVFERGRCPTSAGAARLRWRMK